MANERRRVRHWGEEPEGMHLVWPIWEGEEMNSKENEIVGANNGWGTGEDFNRPWRAAAESNCDEIDANWRQQRRTRVWKAKGALVRGARAKARIRGRGDGLRHQSWGINDAAGPSDLAYDANHSGGEIKQECDEQPSIVGMDVEAQPGREEISSEVTGGGEHDEIESHTRHLLRIVEQARRSFESKDQEHRNLYKKAKLEAQSEHQQRLDLQQKLFNVCDENEKLTGTVATLQTEVDREKKTWRERIVKHEGKISKLQSEIEQLNGVRGEKVKLTNELDDVRAQLQSEQSKSTKLQERLTILEIALKTLQDSLDRTTHDLQEEKEKALCQICMDRPRDTCSLPCVHLNYCSQCLLKHLETNKTCPACRTPTSGTLQTSLYTIM